MVVICLADCPQKVRGDLTKWLLEISTGVYCGHVSARVREELWKRICENIKNGRVTMVYSAPGEQHLDFKVHNSDWEPVDFDGLKLIMHPAPNKKDEEYKDDSEQTKRTVLSNVEIQRKSRNRRKRNVPEKDYCVIDIETTGLSFEKDEIIEIAALRVREHRIVDTFSILVKSTVRIPSTVTELTGITENMLDQDGKGLKESLKDFTQFVLNDILVGYNTNFDYAFLQTALDKCGLTRLQNLQFDVLALARKKLEDVENYKLATVAKYLEVEEDGQHRALVDCRKVYGVYNKLNEI